MRSAEHDELDQLLDAGLAAYAGKDPWPGLEERVLSRIEGAKVRRRRVGWWGFALAIPAAVCLLAILQPKPAVRQDLRAAAPEAPVAEVKPAAPPPRARERARSGNAAGDPVVGAAAAAGVRDWARVGNAARPKRAQFPTPGALTEEERALRELAVRTPEVLLPQSAQPGIPAMEIAPIQIEPLPGGSPNEELNR